MTSHRWNSSPTARSFRSSGGSGRAQRLPEAVAGEPCIGLALACHQKYPGVLETLNDFDLVDEAGRAVLVQVTGARMLGASNVTLTDGKARRLLIASLDLPTGAVATGWDAFVLRDGDPVMAVGFKQTTLDPTQTNLRSPPARTSLAIPAAPATADLSARGGATADGGGRGRARLSAAVTKAPVADAARSSQSSA